MKSTSSEPNDAFQLPVSHNMSRVVGTVMMSAVKAASSLGEKFLVENMVTKLKIKFVTYAFYCSDTVDAQFLPYFTDVYINGTVAHNHIVAPNLAEDFVS